MSTIRKLKVCVHKECITNTLPPKERGILFSFPRKNSLRHEWLMNMNRIDLKDLSHRQLTVRGYRVCHLHFDDNQFQNELKLKLNFNQVPRPVFNPDAENLLPAMEQSGKGAVIMDIGQAGKSTASIDDIENLLPEMGQSDKDVVLADIEQAGKSTASIEASSEQLALKQLDIARQRDLASRKQSLYRRLRTTRRLLTLSRVWRRTFADKFKRSQVDRTSDYTLDHVAKIHALPRVLRILILSLLRNFAKYEKARSYALEEKCRFLCIMKHDPNCYIFLQRLLGLPSIRTLKRLLANFKLYPGINDRLFEYLSSVSESLKAENRYCVIMFDEMELSKSMSMSNGKDACSEGFIDTVAGRESILADHVLVFMIRGICKKWKQPIAFYFTLNAADSLKLKALILQVVRAVHEKTKFQIMASVCDTGLRNVTALQNLTTDSGRDINDFVYNVDGHEIIHLFDAPHLLKCMRNNFMTKNIIFKGKVARWSDIRMIYEKDGINGTSKVTKLTNSHVNPSTRQKMKVKLAAQVFSFSTAAFLCLLTNFGAIDAGGTAEFVKFMDDLFDSMNSVTVSSKALACKVTCGSPHSQFWLKARSALSQIKFLVDDNQVPNPQFLQLLISTLRNMKCLWETLQNSGFEYFNTRSLNQDPVENLFSVVRGLCGGNSRPSTTQFVDAYKTAILNNTVRCHIGSNCEDDGANLLLSSQILLSSNTSDPLDFGVTLSTSSTLFLS